MSPHIARLRQCLDPLPLETNTKARLRAGIERLVAIFRSATPADVRTIYESGAVVDLAHYVNQAWEALRTPSARVVLWLRSIEYCYAVWHQTSASPGQGGDARNASSKVHDPAVAGVLRNARALADMHERALYTTLGEDDPVDALLQWIGTYCRFTLPRATDVRPSNDESVSFLTAEHDRFEGRNEGVAAMLLSIVNVNAILGEADGDLSEGKIMPGEEEVYIQEIRSKLSDP